MLIEATRDGVCDDCGERFAAGDTISWQPGPHPALGRRVHRVCPDADPGVERVGDGVLDALDRIELKAWAPDEPIPYVPTARDRARRRWGC